MENNQQTVQDTVNTELTSTQINSVEDVVGQVVVTPSSQAEDDPALATSGVTNNLQMLLTVNGAGPSIRINDTNLERPRLILVAGSIMRRCSPQMIQLIAQNASGNSGESNPFRRRYIELRYELLKGKLNLLKLKRDGLAKQFDIRMKLLKTRLYFEKKKLHMFRKKYGC